jgi:hypothetical protein
MTPIQQAQEVIDKYQWSLYSVPYCVEVMSGLLKHIQILEAGNQSLSKHLGRLRANAEPM